MTNLRNSLLVTFALIGSSLAFAADIIYSSPSIIQRSSTGIIIYYNAAEGTAGLKGLTSGVYAHTGVITSSSSSDSDWQYAPTWGDNSSKYAMTYVSTDLWSLEIGDIDSYYGTSSSETVTRLAFVFRNSDCTLEGKDTGSADIFVEVYEDGLAVSLSSNGAGSVLTDETSTVTFTVNTTQSADINLYIDSTTSSPIASASSATTLSQSYTFATGDYDVIATATADGTTVSDTLQICHRSDSQEATYSGTLLQGANANSDGSVTFCLYAPYKSNVMLVGEWDNYRILNTRVMNYQGESSDRYFWLTIPSGTLDMDTEYGYYFIVDDDIYVADPYAKLILDPWNDQYINEDYTRYENLKSFPSDKVSSFAIAVFKGNGYSYDWEVENFSAPDADNLIIYEMLLRDFTDEQCLETAMEKLDYLDSLGINAIELMPIMEFDGNNSWGYNPNFYFAPDKYYGSPEMYKKFIDQCHKRGIAVILDVVFNQSWGQHPWCKMYWDDTNSIPSTDNPFYNSVAPHNYSVGNDWKHEVTAVRNYFCDVLQYWLEEYKVDGYRFDLVKGLGDSSSYSSNYEGDSYNSSRLANVKRFIEACQSVNSNCYCIMEAFVATSEENAYAAAGAMSWKNMNSAYTQVAKGYSASSAFTGMYSGDESRPHGSIVGYMESHDEERLAYAQKSGSSTAKVTVYAMRRLGSCAAFAILVPGPKMIWQFGEMGYDTSGGNGDTDPKEPLWEYLDNSYRKGLHDSYQELINLRINNSDLFSSSAEFYWSVTTSDWDDGRFITARNTTTGKELVAVMNPNTSQKTFSYTFDTPGGTYYTASKTYSTSPTYDTSAGTVTVPAHSYVVITNFDPEEYSGITSVAADEAQLCLYPNPATDAVTVNAEGVEAIAVYSIAGQLVATSTGSSTIDVSALAQGHYIIQAKTASGTLVQKLIKK